MLCCALQKIKLHPALKRFVLIVSVMLWLAKHAKLVALSLIHCFDEVKCKKIKIKSKGPFENVYDDFI